VTSKVQTHCCEAVFSTNTVAVNGYWLEASQSQYYLVLLQHHSKSEAREEGTTWDLEEEMKTWACHS
jgi:hypothetical protein